MHGTQVVFGERVVLLDHVAPPLPMRLLVPGPGTTVADRAEKAVDPVAAQRRAAAAETLGIALTAQDEVDFPAAQRLSPHSESDRRFADAVLDLGSWRYRVEHCAPGPRLAALLEERPAALEPAPGTGRVTAETITIPAGPGRPAGIVTVHTPDPDRAPAPAEGEHWPDTVLATIQARQRMIAYLQAEQYTDIAALSACYPGIHQFLASELALALHTTDTEAAGLLDDAHALHQRLPDTRDALGRGDIDDAKARAIIRATSCCSPDVAHAVEADVLPDAGGVTAPTVRRRAARAVIAADPDGAAERHRRARSERHVWRAPDGDGMARLGLYAPAQDVAMIWQAITAVADAIHRPDDGRTLGQRRAAALTMLCTDIVSAGGWAGLALPGKVSARTRVTVTVPYTALLGHRAPCELDGYGPICAEQALPLIADGDLYRMVCDPLSGMLLDYGHTRYRPPPHLAEFVRRRDGQCPMPSCGQPADRGHLDHIVPARCDPATGRPTFGTTSADNLATPCAHHHLSKDAGRGFRLHRASDGTYTWTTPLGRSYTWRPEPHWHQSTDAIAGSGPPGTAGSRPPGIAGSGPPGIAGSGPLGTAEADAPIPTGSGPPGITGAGSPARRACQHGPDVGPGGGIADLTDPGDDLPPF